MNDDIVQRAESMLENRLPPGTLELAVNDPAIWAQLEVAAQLCDFVPELVAEIKRLRIELDNVLTDLQHENERVEVMHLRRENELRQMNELGTQNNDLMANCNQLRDRCWKAESELARWQEIAIDATAMQLDGLPNTDRCEHRTGYEYCDLLNGTCDGYPQMLEICPIRIIGDRWPPKSLTCK